MWHLLICVGGIVTGIGVIIFLSVVKMDMDADFKDLNKDLDILHIERMDKGTDK